MPIDIYWRISESDDEGIINDDNDDFWKDDAFQNSKKSCSIMTRWEDDNVGGSRPPIDSTNEGPPIDTTGTNKETKKVSKPKAETALPTKKKTNKKRSGFWTLLRVLLLDFPVLIVLGAFACLGWVRYVTDNYLAKQLKDAEWTEYRATDTDITYYTRPCVKEDMSTLDGSELFLSDSATPTEAYNHQLRHGFTVFPRILSEDTARNVRKYFDDRNRNVSEAESNFVIAGENRYSFNPGMDDPAVIKAVEEITNNEFFKDSIEAILGRNPALIEMTAITSSFGAENQRWHDDVIPEASPVQFARAFGPSYSIFIMLQNTTKQMGATEVCPGLHMCADGPIKEVCRDNGFQLVGENGYWRAGDALLMNMNSWHRGAAHTDPNAPDRVMLILTFVPRPRTRAESRQLAQGITFSLRWDMWGHTWNDLMNAASAMKQPWATLRSLGLYKEPKAEWGVDFISSATMRMANEDNGFKSHELGEFVNLYGGFKFLPKWLHGEVSEDEETAWDDFLLDTLGRCQRFMTIATKAVVGGYVLVYFLVSLLSKRRQGDAKQRIRRFVWSLVRLGVIVGTVAALYVAATRHVDNTQWASDIRNGLRYTSPFGNEESRYVGRHAFPHRNDVLIESRFKSDYLAMYNDYVSNHPGNRLWNELIQDKVPTYTSYSGLDSGFRQVVAQYIVFSMYEAAARFLYQDDGGDFVLISAADAVSETERELNKRANPIRAKVLTELDYLISDAKYGPLRKSRMSSEYALPFLRTLKSRLMNSLIPAVSVPRTTSILKPRSSTNTPSRQAQYLPTVVLPTSLKSISSHPRRQVTLAVGKFSPSPFAHLQIGKAVEVRIGKKRNAYWYLAEVKDVYSTSEVLSVVVHSGRERETYHDNIRPYSVPEIGEEVEVKMKDKKWKEGIIVGQKGNGLFDVEVDGKILNNHAASIRRQV